MKTKNIFGLGALMVIGGMLGSCSSDYLNQPPIDSISQERIGESVEAAQAALYGICQGMNIGTYGDQGTRFFMGEGYIQTYYGDSTSPDFWDSFLWGSQSDLQGWTTMRNKGFTGASAGWMYGYNLIGQCNRVLTEIDKLEGVDNERDFIKAQVLTIRAHAYVRLMQIYAPRYEDRKNGEALCLVLREEPTLDALPLSTYDDCVTFIKKDLDDALRLYEGSTAKRTQGFEPDINVCKGVYSRLALMTHDWDTAITMASEARASYPIMSAEEYGEGFFHPNGEWLWYNDPDFNYVGYNSWGASFACNGDYANVANWSSAGCISYQNLYKPIYDRHSDDVRCDLFWTPDKVDRYVKTGAKAEWFWDENYVDQTFYFMYVKGSGNERASLNAAIALWVAENYPGDEICGGRAYKVQEITEEEAKSKLKRSTWNNKVASDGMVQFGAQCKFYSDKTAMGAVQHPFMRGAELLLNQAEALCEKQLYTQAAKLLEELNKQRIPNYTCNLTGDELRDEIRLYRRMELWGEGDTWFSFKRWNLPIERTVWEAGNMESDNFTNTYKGYYEPSFGAGWRYMIPASETNYNSLVADQIAKMDD